MNQITDPLAELRDIHLPAEPGWWPPAPGWWLLAVLLIVVFAFVTRWLKQRRANRASTKAFVRALQHIKAGTNTEETHQELIEVSQLLRQYMITRFGRNRVAKLHGHQWLAFLDKATDSNLFTIGAGRYLENLPYRKAQPEVTGELRGKLLEWLKRNPAGVVID